jgi:hypothetical protein
VGIPADYLKENIMQISIASIKKLMFKELHNHYSSACQNCDHDVQRAFIHIGYRKALEVLESAQDETDLGDYLSMMDYRMSVIEWLESL